MEKELAGCSLAFSHSGKVPVAKRGDLRCLWSLRPLRARRSFGKAWEGCPEGVPPWVPPGAAAVFSRPFMSTWRGGPRAGAEGPGQAFLLPRGPLVHIRAIGLAR